MADIRELIVGGDKVVLDPNRLDFNEANLGKYMETEAGWYDYFGQKLADAEYDLAKAEEEYDQRYATAFRLAKDGGASDKLAESTAKCDTDVQVSKAKVQGSKYKVKSIQQHLRAWDKNHENAQNRGYTLRKEMDKLSGRIYSSSVGSNDWTDQSRQIDDMVKPADQQDLSNLPD